MFLKHFLFLVPLLVVSLHQIKYTATQMYINKGLNKWRQINHHIKMTLNSRKSKKHQYCIRLV